MEFESRAQVEAYLRSTENIEGSKQKSVLSKVVEVTAYFIEKTGMSSLYTSVEEIQDILSTLDKVLKQGKNLERRTIRKLSVLFAPSGPIQDISIDGGWSKIFFLLARYVDETLRI